MADCEGKECYERVYEARKPNVTSVGGVAAQGLAKDVLKAAQEAMLEKARRPKPVNCDAPCECVKSNEADTPFGEWKTRPVKTTITVGGQEQEVIGTVERRSRKTKRGYCEDPNELTVFLPGEWDGALVAVALAHEDKPRRKPRKS